MLSSWHLPCLPYLQTACPSPKRATCEGEVGGLCTHADASNVGSQREVARALANIAAAEENHRALLAEGALALCLDLVVSNSAEVQQQATRVLGNLALSEERSVHETMEGEGAL